MDLHPIFVHFPIALLTVYALMEMISFKKIAQKEYWFYVKFFFLVIGVIGAFAALYTGNLAQHNYARDSIERQIIRVHQSFAISSTIVFGVLAFAYIISFMQKRFNVAENQIWKLILKIKDVVLNRYISFFLALLGLACISITGALGGSIVYGPDADPFVSFVYHFFF